MPGDRIPHSTIAYSGDGYRTITINQMINKITASAPIMFMGTLVLALGTISAAVVVPKVLDAAAAKQCLSNDWPAESHAAHIEWCKDNGYKTN
jgi:hypothetical protein